SPRARESRDLDNREEDDEERRGERRERPARPYLCAQQGSGRQRRVCQLCRALRPIRPRRLGIGFACTGRGTKEGGADLDLQTCGAIEGLENFYRASCVRGAYLHR